MPAYLLSGLSLMTSGCGPDWDSLLRTLTDGGGPVVSSAGDVGAPQSEPADDTEGVHPPQDSGALGATDARADTGVLGGDAATPSAQGDAALRDDERSDSGAISDDPGDASIGEDERAASPAGGG